MEAIMADLERTYSLKQPGTLTFSNLFDPKPVGKKGVAKGDPKYDATIAIDPDGPDAKAIKALCTALAKEKWPNRDIGADYKSGELRMPWHSGDKLAAKAEKNGKKQDFHKGRLVIVARSKDEPTLTVLVNGQPSDLEGLQRAGAKSKFYAGVKCGANFYFQAYDAVGEDGKDGVAVYLNGVLSTGQGERVMGGSRDPAEVYSGFIGIDTDESALGDGEADVEL
jgi:hypothetical protein